MRIPLTVAVLLLGATGTVLAQDPVKVDASVEQALLQLERDWEQANAKNDVAALERILAPEFVSTDSEGRLSTRDQVFARRKSGQVTLSSFIQDDYKVRIIGDVAIVTGRSTIKGSRDGKSWSGQERWTDAFVRRDGRWQAVATHSSRVATP